jgi:hypothetical protein
MLLRAFERDFEANGPSVVRIARTLLRGWRRHKHHPEPRVRRRFARECRDLATAYAGMLWASEHALRANRALVLRMREVRRAIAAEFGWKSRLAAPVVGSVLRATIAREARRLRRGHTYEPPTYFELNEAASRLEGSRAGWTPCRFVQPNAPEQAAGIEVAARSALPLTATP